MKKYTIILLVAIGLMFYSCESNKSSNVSTDIVNNSKSATKVAKDGSMPKILFEETEHDFGNMIQGERVIYGFHFTNIGGSDLLITHVSTSCGCTVGDYPRNAIAPGESGIIEVTFDSKKRKGYQNKTITVLANTNPNSTTLRIKTKIILPEQN
jgi:hypothetical protein